MPTAISEPLLRDLELEIAFNVRHIGGYASALGGVTTERLLRSASLHGLTRGAIGALADSGVTTVVDLRSSVELERDVTPDLAWAGIRTVHAPVFEQDASPPAFDAMFPGYAPIYEQFLETGRAAYRTLAETVARSDGTVLFHCAAGKDRTGVGAALLLELAGVDAAVIVDDYSRSAALLEPMRALMRERMAAEGLPPLSPERVEELMASHPADMAATLSHIAVRWGNAEGYLRDCGVGSGDISAARARLLA